MKIGGSIMKNIQSLFIASLSAIIIFLSLYLSIIVKAKVDFEFGLLVAYGIISLIGFALSMFMSLSKVRTIPFLFLFASLLAGIFLYVQMPTNQDSINKLGATVGWMLIMGIAIIICLVSTIYFLFTKSKK